ncbi:MAG TPA: FAD-binding oxidoreductase [Ktedonobacterales bacterium]|nr:FAD-binding oxidoreductase [Ktedonobacterales bacterium]
MAFPGTRATLTNWSKSDRSSCYVIQTHDTQDITQALGKAREQGRTLIPHGAGHSYTDAALNTGGVVLDLTPMQRILAWDPTCGVMRVEPGATLREVVALAWQDGWWPAITPSTPAVTIGGCVAMNVTGKNAWRCGCFGDYVLAVEVALPSGALVTLSREQDAQLFHAIVGGLGLLGVITSVTLQLCRLGSGRVVTRTRSAASFADIGAIFAEEETTSDYLEAWIDGFAEGSRLGRGHVSCATISPHGVRPRFRLKAPMPASQRQASPATGWVSNVSQLALRAGVGALNRAAYWGMRWRGALPPLPTGRRSLLPYTFYSPLALLGYHTLLPRGVETFQAFVPAAQASEVFVAILSFAHKFGFRPIWCVVKRHRPDPFLLSYQVDGFSLELNFPRTARNATALEAMLHQLTGMVIGAGGRFYLAKDRFMTGEQYRVSLGDDVVNTFLRLKREVDPQTTLQSNLFRRIFQWPL